MISTCILTVPLIASFWFVPSACVVAYPLALAGLATSSFALRGQNSLSYGYFFGAFMCLVIAVGIGIASDSLYGVTFPLLASAALFVSAGFEGARELVETAHRSMGHRNARARYRKCWDCWLANRLALVLSTTIAGRLLILGLYSHEAKDTPIEGTLSLTALLLLLVALCPVMCLIRGVEVLSLTRPQATR